MKLNRASLDIWYKMHEDSKYQDISERIIYLDGIENLTPDEVQEKETLIKLEKKFLKEASDFITEERKITAVVNIYTEKLKSDERLQTIFQDRVMADFLNNKLDSIEKVDLIYKTLREEDIDLEGHAALNKIYDDIMNNTPLVDHDYSELGLSHCTNADCIYCKEVTLEENQKAATIIGEAELYMQDPKMVILQLVISLNRVKDMLAEFKNTDCEHDFYEDDEDDLI